eukprot:3745565-Rhodomonas_salina.1
MHAMRRSIIGVNALHGTLFSSSNMPLKDEEWDAQWDESVDANGLTEQDHAAYNAGFADGAAAAGPAPPNPNPSLLLWMMNASVNDDYHTTYTEPDASTFAPMYDGMFETDTDGSDESINVSEGMPDDAKSTDAGTDAVLMDTTDLGPDSLGPSTYSPVSNAAQHNTSVPKPQVTEFINSADIQADPTPTPPNVQRDAHAALNSVLEQTNANTLSMLFSLILLWVNAICFTGHIWYHVAMRTMYTITTILAFACPVQINPKKPDKFEAKLSNGTMLYSLCNPISPRAMLNSITSESLANMFGRKRKSGLAANDPQPQAHSSRAIPN